MTRQSILETYLPTRCDILREPAIQNNFNDFERPSVKTYTGELDLRIATSSALSPHVISLRVFSISTQELRYSRLFTQRLSRVTYSGRRYTTGPTCRHRVGLCRAGRVKYFKLFAVTLRVNMYKDRQVFSVVETNQKNSSPCIS